MEKDRATPLERFKQQRQRSISRGIAWDLTFDEWMLVWSASGKFALRGKKVGQYVMARKGDKGPYSIDNVFICLFSENIKDAYRNKPGNSGGHMNLGRGKGWCYREGKLNPYQVIVKNKYIGCFKTAELAEIAYKAEVEKIFRLAQLVSQQVRS